MHEAIFLHGLLQQVKILVDYLGVVCCHPSIRQCLRVPQCELRGSPPEGVPPSFGHLNLGTLWIYDLLHNSQDLLAWLSVAYRSTTANKISHPTLLLVTEKPTVRHGFRIDAVLFRSLVLECGSWHPILLTGVTDAYHHLLNCFSSTDHLPTVAAVCGWTITGWQAGAITGALPEDHTTWDCKGRAWPLKNGTEEAIITERQFLFDPNCIRGFVDSLY